MENLREMDKLIVHRTWQGKSATELENRPMETMQIEGQRKHKFENTNKASINEGGLLQKSPQGIMMLKMKAVLGLEIQQIL